MKLAIITGGSRGLGQALFQQLGDLGYQLIDFSRSAPYEVSHQIDLSVTEQAHQIIQATLADIDGNALEELLVINNAATNLPIGPPAEQEADAIIAHLNTNLVSQILFLTAIMAKFREAACPKRIANITSGAASYAFEGFSLYCASKAGMEQFVRTVAAEQQREQAPFALINVDPGVMDTDMQTIMRGKTEVDFPAVQRFIALKEEGNLPAPTETAATVIKILTKRDLVSGERYQVQDF
jgi:benzil reductase ((S)-benzoin forming)